MPYDLNDHKSTAAAREAVGSIHARPHGRPSATVSHGTSPHGPPPVSPPSERPAAPPDGKREVIP